MTAVQIPRREFDKDGWRHDNPFSRGQRMVRERARNFRRVSSPAIRALNDHWLTVSAIVCISAAFFQISSFAGLLVTGVLLVLFEMKVSE